MNTLCHSFFAKTLLFMQLLIKILNSMANSVDPDQTSGEPDLGQHCLHMSFSHKVCGSKFLDFYHSL